VLIPTSQEKFHQNVALGGSSASLAANCALSEFYNLRRLNLHALDQLIEKFNVGQALLLTATD